MSKPPYRYKKERADILREPWTGGTVMVHMKTVALLKVQKSVTVGELRALTHISLTHVAATLDYLTEIGILTRVYGGEDIKLSDWAYAKAKETA